MPGQPQDALLAGTAVAAAGVAAAVTVPAGPEGNEAETELSAAHPRSGQYSELRNSR